jgi:hypothetical protein
MDVRQDESDCIYIQTRLKETLADAIFMWGETVKFGTLRLCSLLKICVAMHLKSYGEKESFFLAKKKCLTKKKMIFGDSRGSPGSQKKTPLLLHK